jgi:hypothetical protein
MVGICCWTPEGVTGELFGAMASYMPPPPDYAQPPLLWGTEEHVREMFEPVASDFRFERRSATIEWESAEGFADYFMSRFGPFVAAERVLGERFSDLRSDVIDVWERWNESDDAFVLPQEYLVSLVRL